MDRQYQHWNNDERLKHLDPERVNLLMEFAKELAESPKDKKMTAFISINQRASEKNMVFSPEERDLMLSVLTENMTPDEKKKVQLIQTLVSKLPGTKSQR